LLSRIGWCFTILLSIAATSAKAWSAQGHMATGAITYDLLSRDAPGVVAEIERLMRDHPDRARFDSALQGLDGPARTRRLFELIARWPDDIRGTHYSHVPWHHELRVVSGWHLLRGIRLGGADHGFLTSLALVRDGRADPGPRAIALCWLFHIAADMHQPLHAGHRMDARFPLTDRAGTIGWVRRGAGAAAEPFHHFWDTAADWPGDDLAGADSIVRAVESGLRPIRPAADVAQSYRIWVRESEEIAADVAYRDEALAESRRADAAPLLSPGYISIARAESERRLAQAGARIAGLLEDVFDPAGDDQEVRSSLVPDAPSPESGTADRSVSRGSRSSSGFP
jgi:hypothetical protein